MTVLKRILFMILVSLPFLNTVEAEDADSSVTQIPKTNLVEIGLNGLGIGVEYHYCGNKYFSLDVIVSSIRPGLALGSSFTPISFVFIQGFVGTKSLTPEPNYAIHPDVQQNFDVTAVNPGAPFTMTYGWRAGIHFPIVPRKHTLFVSLAGGDGFVVRKGSDVINKVEIFSAGLVIKF